MGLEAVAPPPGPEFDWDLLRWRNSSLSAFMASNKVSCMFCATTESSTYDTRQKKTYHSDAFVCNGFIGSKSDQ